MPQIDHILKSYQIWELAYTHAYLYPGMMSESQHAFDAHLAGRGIDQQQLQLALEARQAADISKEKLPNCDRCGSGKIDHHPNRKHCDYCCTICGYEYRDPGRPVAREYAGDLCDAFFPHPQLF